LPDICRLRGLVRIAVKRSYNTGRPWTDWSVYNNYGWRLDGNMALRDLPDGGLPLYLSLRIGVGGCVSLNDQRFSEAA
jgi:hypothetical protein